MKKLDLKKYLTPEQIKINLKKSTLIKWENLRKELLKIKKQNINSEIYV